MCVARCCHWCMQGMVTMVLLGVAIGVARLLLWCC